MWPNEEGASGPHPGAVRAPRWHHSGSRSQPGAHGRRGPSQAWEASEIKGTEPTLKGHYFLPFPPFLGKAQEEGNWEPGSMTIYLLPRPPEVSVFLDPSGLPTQRVSSRLQNSLRPTPVGVHLLQPHRESANVLAWPLGPQLSVSPQDALCSRHTKLPVTSAVR